MRTARRISLAALVLTHIILSKKGVAGESAAKPPETRVEDAVETRAGVEVHDIYGYSPYHHVRKETSYPAILFITGDADTRVAPLHARKMTALLQSSTGADTQRQPILLHYDTKAGHSRGFNTPLSKTIEDLTDELSFLFAETGGKYRALEKPPAKKAA